MKRNFNINGIGYSFDPRKNENPQNHHAHILAGIKQGGDYKSLTFDWLNARFHQPQLRS